jgi:prolipoprotein diacylglyceryltransferase
MEKFGNILLFVTQLTAWSRVLLEKPLVPQLVKNFPAVYGIQRFITVFTRAPHLFLY